MPPSFSADIVGWATTFTPIMVEHHVLGQGAPICEINTIHGMIQGVRAVSLTGLVQVSISHTELATWNHD